MTRLIVHTSKSATLFSHMHELGTSFYCKGEKDTYRVIYYATNREIHFEGQLTETEAERLRVESTEVKSIEYDRFKDELVITE